MDEPAKPQAPNRQPKRMPIEYLKGRAAFLALYLRQIEGLAPDQAAAVIMEQYPRVRPYVEKLARKLDLPEMHRNGNGAPALGQSDPINLKSRVS